LDQSLGIDQLSGYTCDQADTFCNDTKCYQNKISWNDFQQHCQPKAHDCSDASKSIQALTITALVSSIMKLVSACCNSRMTRSEDTGYKKCTALLTFAIPLTLMSVQVAQFTAYCKSNVDDRYNSSYGAGYILFVFALVFSFLSFVIHLIVPVPADEGKC